MGKKFIVGVVEYQIVINPINGYPMIARVDGFEIENRKEICRIYLRSHGWTNDMFGTKTTQDLERRINIMLKENGEEKEIVSYDEKHQFLHKRKRSFQNVRPLNIPTPSEAEVESYLKKWDTLEDYDAQEKALDKVFFGEFSSNNNLENILIKCSILNDFYSTNIFKVFPVAKHIYDLNIDKRLNEGDPTLVDDISDIEINGVMKRFYSFATKYCSHHKPLEYPIYDSYVQKVLLYFAKVDHFYSFDALDLKKYSEFKNILLEFRRFYKLEKYNLKELDKFLWQFGKRYFPKAQY